MQTGTNNVAASDASARKAARLQLGRLESPITVSTVMKKEQTHDFGGKKGVSWAVITQDGKLVKATTYDGNLGKDFNLGDHNTQPLPAEGTKDLRKAIKGYSPVTNPSEYPAFVVAASTPEADGPTEEADGE